MRRDLRSWFAPTTILLAGLAVGAGGEAPAVEKAIEGIRPGAILDHIKVLASDAFEGRGPGTPGEQKTVAYIADQLRKMGVKPGNPDGTYVQDVPLVGFRATKVDGTIRGRGGPIGLKFPEDFVAVSRPGAAKGDHYEVGVGGSEVVFVGYGVVAPEYGWDDYKGLDVRGKTLLMLVNDPPVPDPKDPSQLDEATFKGRAMTYYGRWTYKYEIASEKGAKAAILIHETGPAGYPFEVVRGSWSRENFDIDGAQGDRVAVEGWVTEAKAREILQAGGRDLDALKKAAARPDFRPVPLGSVADFAVSCRRREVKSKNVLGRVEGSDPDRKDELVVYTAHWDHLGRDPERSGDQIFNGAADNASGVAAILEVAHAFTRIEPAPKRSVLFLFVTAEEQGLLGAKYYASHPLYPLEKTVADINLDVINLWGPTREILSIGMGQTDLDDRLVEIAGRHGRTVAPDASPEKGYYYRSDHFEFAKQGVPAMDPKGGRNYVGKSADFGQKKQDDYTANDYHKPTDEVKPDWDLTGAAEDLELLVELGYRVAEEPGFPAWKPGSEFKARREAMMKAAKP